MKPLSHPAVTAFGAATIIFMVWLAPLASTMHKGLFHTPGSLNVVVIPLFIGFFLVWLFWTLLITVTRHRPTAATWVWAIMTVILVRELIEAWYQLKPTDKLWEEPNPVPRTVNLVFALLVVLLLTNLRVVHRRFPGLIGRARVLILSMLGFVALSGAFTWAQIAVYTWQARDMNAARPLHEVSSTSHHKRVLWLLLDELSYRQVYEHRYHDLEMPAFDRLAQESTIFTNARPQGRLTENVTPSLLTGINGDDNKAPAAGLPLYLHNADTKKWQEVDQHQTVFQDALNAGYNPGAVGWWMPYCRFLPEVLDRCYWTATTQLVAGMYTDESIGWNLKHFLKQPLRDRASQLRILQKKDDPNRTDQHYLYDQLVAAGDTQLNDPQLNFLYFHMNVPHPQGFYDRHKGTFNTFGTTYIDNLALADIYLAHVRSVLEANGTWDDTTVVIMGDHSWRTNFIWAKTKQWGAEEQAASDGDKFDDRPAYIVKLAGQTAPTRIDTPFDAIRSRSLFDAMFVGQITTPGQLAAWAK